MKSFISLLYIALITSISYGQNFDGYKYVAVQTLIYQNGGIDNFGVSTTLRTNFNKKGFTVISEEYKDWPNDAKSNPCLVMVCYPSTKAPSTVGLIIKNCKDEIIFEEQYTSSNWFNDYQGNFNIALYNVWNVFNKNSFQYDTSKNIEKEYPEVENTNESEETLTNYFDNNKLDELEGVYKSYQSDYLEYYKIGIKKYGSLYKAIIIESNYSYWKKGEVKAILEPSSIKGLYSIKWYMGDKTSYETFALLERQALLTIEFPNQQTGEKSNGKFIKIYPSVDMNSLTSTSEIKSTGSGFVVSADGIIATNAHIIDDASKIEISLPNELGVSKYIAKVLLKDKSNDVALIKIEDDNFRGFNTLPYRIIEQVEIGEEVFTIGYPLNIIMGENYKVTNGIISSITGIQDDIRYLQITTPIQPGNSGGPLFNKNGDIVGITTAKLNDEAIGISTENVNYAIKASYLINIYKMLTQKNPLPQNSILANKELKDQIKVLKNYVCLIEVY